MFTATDIQARLRQQPFVPLRIITSGGQTFDIYHPDLVLVAQRYLLVGTASADNPTILDKHSQLGVMHVTAMENLPSQAAPTGNGEK